MKAPFSLRPLCILVAVAVFSAVPSESFSVVPLTSSSNVPLPSSRLCVSTLESSSADNMSPPSWMELPSKTERTPAERLDGLELIVGRIAMMGATGILLKELWTGESIVDQCQDAIHQCIAHI